MENGGKDIRAKMQEEELTMGGNDVCKKIKE